MRFTELIQARKLFERDPRLPALADKVLVKRFVADRLGDEWIIPTLWHGDSLPIMPPWPRPFIVKSRHGCNQTIVVAAGDPDWRSVRQRAAGWTAKPYGGWLDEWLYRHVTRGILVEPFVGDGDGVPIDYKFYVFAGRVEFVQVHLGRGTRHRWILLDRDWRQVSAPNGDAEPHRPGSLAAMITAAETLARGFDFVRVDLYEVAGRPLFGEMTFYPGSGLDRFDPLSLDACLGEHWRRAMIAADETVDTEEFASATRV